MRRLWPRFGTAWGSGGDFRSGSGSLSAALLTVDGALMRVVDLMLAFPSVFLLLILAAMLEGSSVTGVILFLGLFSWMWLARIIRGEFLSLKAREFVEAARSIEAPDRAIILRHLSPNVLGPIIVSITLDIAVFMVAEASLSLLGFGVQPGTPTWGTMLNESRAEYLTYPRLAIIPGLTLTIAVLAINSIGAGLRDAFDPHGGGESVGDSGQATDVSDSFSCRLSPVHCRL